MVLGLAPVCLTTACVEQSTRQSSTESASETTFEVAEMSLDGPNGGPSTADLEEAARRWNDSRGGDEEGSYTSAFISAKRILAIASSEGARSPFMTEPFTLFEWVLGAWKPISGFGSSLCLGTPSSCSIEVSGDGQIREPLVAISWCCPMEDFRDSPLVTVLRVEGEYLVDVLTGSSSESGWTSNWVSDLSDAGFTTESCDEGETLYFQSFGYRDYYCSDEVFTSYVVTDGRVVSTKRETVRQSLPFEECLWSAGEECLDYVVIFPSEKCPRAQIDIALDFPIRPCTWGYWVSEFETELRKLGYAVEADGYFSDFETPLVRAAQSDRGLSVDGLIGLKTWKAIVEQPDCRKFDHSTGQPFELNECFSDYNRDGVIGPGDIIPD